MDEVSNQAEGRAPIAPDDAEHGNEASILYAKKYLENLLSFFGLNTDIYATNSDDAVIELHVPSTHLNAFLIGHNGETLRALQFLVSSALKNNGFAMSRVSVDIADYKKARADRLSEKAVAWLEEVKKTSQDKHLEPMNAADRRTIHQLASDYGLTTESQGEGRERHIVLKASTDTSKDATSDAES